MGPSADTATERIAAVAPLTTRRCVCARAFARINGDLERHRENEQPHDQREKLFAKARAGGPQDRPSKECADRDFGGVEPEQPA
jgi:hypothetical protein